MIYGKVGNLGHGKTMRMVVDGVAMARQRGAFADPPRCWIVSNIAIRPATLKKERDPIVLQLPMDSFSESLAAVMTRARQVGVGGVVMIDEIDVVWDAHRWQDMSTADRYRIKQSRKGTGFDVYWSAQFVDQVEKSIRNITEEVELVRAFPPPTNLRRDNEKRPWFIRGQRFRPGAVRELLASPDPDRRLGRTFHRYRRTDEMLYNTDEVIAPAEAIDAGALCATHKAERSKAACPVCHPHVGSRIGEALWDLLEIAAQTSAPASLVP